MLARYTQGSGLDEPLAVLRSGTTTYYEADGLGSVTSLSNSTGALANTYTYDSFGNLSASTGTVTNPLRYTARELDSETGVYFYRSRYMDPSTGRFLSEDPIAFVGGINFYPYVRNNPVNSRDPFGLQDDSVSATLRAAIARGNPNEIEAVLDTAGDVVKPGLRDAARALIQDLRSTAKDLIARRCKGSVNRVFPEELREKTLEEIIRLARQGNKAAQTAKKLLTSSEYLK